jgi:hypothetical protein
LGPLEDGKREEEQAEEDVVDEGMGGDEEDEGRCSIGFPARPPPIPVAPCFPSLVAV